MQLCICSCCLCHHIPRLVRLHVSVSVCSMLDTSFAEGVARVNRRCSGLLPVLQQLLLPRLHYYNIRRVASCFTLLPRPCARGLWGRALRLVLRHSAAAPVVRCVPGAAGMASHTQPICVAAGSHDCLFSQGYCARTSATSPSLWRCSARQQRLGLGTHTPAGLHVFGALLVLDHIASSNANWPLSSLCLPGVHKGYGLQDH